MDIPLLARVMALGVKAASIKAGIAGMVADNEYRRCEGTEPAYTAGDFEHEAVQLREVANDLEEIARG